MYKLNIDSNTVSKGGLSFVSECGNTEDLEYQAWLAKGNIPEPAETLEEITTRLQLETKIAANRYLDKTDKWFLRELETGKKMPTKIKTMRAAKMLEI